MKTAFLVAALCVGLSLANLTIPLKSHGVKTTVNDVADTLVDTVLYAEATVTALGAASKSAAENVVFDINSNTNYVLSAATKYNDAAVSTAAFDCNVQCEEGTKSETAAEVLGGKAKLQAGVTLKDVSKVILKNAEITENLFVPDTVDASVSAQDVAVLKFANVGLNLGRSSNNIVAELVQTSQLVNEEVFSVYVHDTIAQINVGGHEEYLAQPNEHRAHLATVDQTSWAVTITEIKTNNGSQLNAGAAVTAHFDTTSKYVYVPRVEAADPNSEPFLYFMTTKELPCFKPNSNVANTVGYICEASQFTAYSNYSPITFSFKTTTDGAYQAVLTPEDYIFKNEQGNYELIFKFAKAPQTTTDFYLGTSFLNVFYPTFNNERGVVTIGRKFNVAAQATSIENSYLIPVICVGSVLAIASVVALLLILKKVRTDLTASLEIPMYQRNSYYTPVVANSTYPVQTQSVYSPVVATNTLRQSQQVIRQSQNVVRTSNVNYIVQQNY